MAKSLHQQIVAEDQARFLIDYLRDRGVAFGATRMQDGYSLEVYSPIDLDDEVRAQITALKPEILTLMCEEDLIRAARKRRRRK